MNRMRKMMAMGMFGGGAAPLLPYTLDPTAMADGALPAPWVGGTFAVSSNRIVGTPTEGENLLTDGGLENWTSATNLTSWDEAIAGTSTVNQDTDAGDIHGGASAARLDVDASNSNAKVSQTKTGVFALGQWCNLRAWAKSSAAGKTIVVGAANGYAGTGGKTLTTEYAQYETSLRVTSLVGNALALEFYRLSAASSSVFLDDLTCNVLDTDSLIESLDAGVSNATVKGAWTIAPGAIAGVLANLDDPDNPQNFMLAVHSGAGGSISLFKCVSGVYSSVLLNQLAEYAADANIEIRHTDETTYQLWYRGVQIGADQTVNEPAINNNTFYGIFTTTARNSLGRFFCGVGADTVHVPSGADLNQYIPLVSPGDILSLAANGSYTWGAGIYGFSSVIGGAADLRSGTAARSTKVLGNNATITGGVVGISCTDGKQFLYFENINIADQTNIAVNINNANDLQFVNINVTSTVAPGAYVDAWKMLNCDRIDIDGGSTTAISGGSSCDGIEFWGPCNDCTVDDHTVSGFVGAGTHNGFEVYGQDVGQICDNIVFTNCHADGMTNGFSCEGGPNSIAHTNIKAVNCTATNMAGYQAQGIQGATLYVTAGTLTSRDGLVEEIA